MAFLERRTGRRAAHRLAKMSKFNTMKKTYTDFIAADDLPPGSSQMAKLLDAEWVNQAETIKNYGAADIRAGKTSKTLRTMLIEGRRVLEGQVAMDGILLAHGRYKVTGGGMMPWSLEGPVVRDVQFSLATDRTYTAEWECQINSDYELVEYRNCPADAKPLIESALRRVRRKKPHECSVCLKPCKLIQCARCLKVIYCSGSCQKSDWKAHKTFCVAAAAEKSSDK